MKYLIHNDLSNKNRKRIDLFNGAKLSDIKELENFNIEVQDQWTEGTTIKMYVLLSENKIKGSASISFGKFENDYNEKRYLTVDITTKSSTLKNAKILLDAIIKKLEACNKLEINFYGCPAEEEKTITDGFVLEYEHGEMTDIKQYLKDIFKQTKKDLCIR